MLGCFDTHLCQGIPVIAKIGLFSQVAFLCFDLSLLQCVFLPRVPNSSLLRKYSLCKKDQELHMMSAAYQECGTRLLLSGILLGHEQSFVLPLYRAM